MISLRCLTRNNAYHTFSRSLSHLKRDPGINRRKKIVKPSTEDVEFDTFDFDNFESDFMEAHHSYDEYKSEMKRSSEKIKFDIVRRKYFKEKLPNFLTWHDKEHIRYLHSKDPEEWSVEALSEGFPALPGIIKKILKSNYKKSDQKSIERHDKVVEQNWEALKKGKINNLPPNLLEHLKKFTDRKLNFDAFEIPENEQKIVKTIERKPGEFSEIILRYEKLKNKEKDSQTTQNIKLEAQNNLEESTITSNDIVKSKSKRKKADLFTFSELKHSIEGKIMEGNKVDEDEKLIVKSEEKYKITKVEVVQEDSNDSINSEGYSNNTMVELSKYNHTNSEVVVFEQKAKDYSHLIYPQKIQVPKEFYKPGYTYKVNDCYYDSDGTFLYRVPGYCK